MPTCVIEAFERTALSRGDQPALRAKRAGAWVTTSWREYRDHVRAAARALLSLGVEAGDHVVIIGYNCPEWFVADLGAIAAGAIPAGIYTTSTPDQCHYIAHHSRARVAFVENAEQLAKFRAIRDRLPDLRAIVLMHGEPDAGDVLAWSAFLGAGGAITDETLDRRLAAQQPDDVCTLIYTSGTTGVPKGVMLSHTNIGWAVEKARTQAAIRAGEDFITYLPLSHIAEQIFSLHINAGLGTCVWFAESLDLVGETLRDARPHHFLAVPRVWEKMQAKMEAAGAKNPPLKRRIVAWARRQGLAGGYADQRGGKRPLLYPLADALVFSKARAATGLDRARTLVTGAAPISLRTLEFFLSLGLPIFEVYGMSECTATTTSSTSERYRTGRAGFVLPGAEIRIAADGEICIRGPHVFKGYYGDAQATAEAIDADRWLHSGDIGELDADGFLRVTDRKKELIITAGGEKVAPQLIEGHLKSIPLVSQAVVVGEGRRYLAALLTLDADKLPAVAAAVGSAARTPEEAAACPRIAGYIQREIDSINQRLARFQTVKRFAILPRELSIDGGELTPTLKLRRKVIAQKYADVIEGLYAEAPPPS